MGQLSLLRQRFLQDIADRFPYPYYIVDVKDYAIVQTNQDLSTLDPSVNPTCYAHRFRFYVPCTGKEFMCPLMMVRKTRKPATVEHEFYTKEKKKRIEQVHGYPLFDNAGSVAFMFVYVVDITEQRYQQEDRAQTAKELMDLKQLFAAQEEALERKKVALHELVDQLDVEKNLIKENIAANIQEVIMPQIKNIERKMGADDLKEVAVLKDSLASIASSFGVQLAKHHHALTPRENEICSLIRQGMSSKEIAKILNTTFRTVENHRNHIRKKLDIANKGINLTSYLQSL